MQAIPSSPPDLKPPQPVDHIHPIRRSFAIPTEALKAFIQRHTEFQEQMKEYRDVVQVILPNDSPTLQKVDKQFEKKDAEKKKDI
jgi:hypothetical protein